MRIGIIILLFLLSFGSWSQEIRIDESEKTRSHVDNYNEKASFHQNEDSVYFYYNRAILIARSIEYYDGELAACKGLINLYKNDTEVYERLRYTLLLVRLYEKGGSTSDKVSGYQQLGRLYFDEMLFSKAAENFQRGFDLKGLSAKEKYEAGIWLTRSLRNGENLDDALLASRDLQFVDGLTSFQQISLQKEKAEIYHQLRAYNEELGAYREIVRLSKGTRYAHFQPTAWNNIGYVHKYLEREKEAKSAFLNTLRTSRNKDRALRAAANYNLGLLYHNESKPDSAMYYFRSAYDLYEDLSDWSSIASCKNMMALSYFHNNDLFNAQKELDAAFEFEKRYDLKHQEAKSHEIQSLFYEDLFDYENSLNSYKRFLSIRDSLLTIERTEKFRLLFDQYRVEQIEKQLRLIWASNDLEMANLARERAKLQAEQERDAARRERDARLLKENELSMAKSKAELQRLQLEEERLNVENKQKELDLIQRDNKLKELALEKERLLVSKNEAKIENLAQRNELIKQRRLNEKQAYRSNLQLIFGILLFIVLILIVILIAYRQLRRRKKRIEEQNAIIAESKKEIEIQKEKSDGLLLNILPLAVAEELKSNGVAKPRMYDDVSVGFTDFSGFTMISEKLTPEELVAKLDTMFLEFDKIIEKYGLQRIKTIGDAYMFAAGLPDPLEDHAERSIRASLEMRDFISKFNSELPAGSPKWQIRIGIHSGPVIAGVIGIKKFAYDIWGDTVNTAARMESSGQIGKVNISGVTKNHINGAFQTEHRGKVAAKNKGDIEMYFVELQ